MKLAKKLFTIACLAFLFTSTVSKSTQKPSCKVTLFANGSTQPSDYKDEGDNIKRPTSIHNITAI